MFFFLVGLVVYSFVIFLLRCFGIAAQYFGFSNFGSQSTTSVQNVVLESAWDFFLFLLCGLTCDLFVLNDQEEAECRDLGEF